MIFYNPFFPPFFRYPQIKSTFNSSSVDKQNKNCSQENVSKKSTQNNDNGHTPSSLAIPAKTQKKNHKKSQSFGFFYNFFQDSDSLILMGLLFFLYNQEDKNFGLMLCLFLLLFDE